MSDKIREALMTFIDLGVDENKAAETWPEIASALTNARAALAQQPDVAEAVEVVATFDGLYLVPVSSIAKGAELMTVAQHKRIVANAAQQPAPVAVPDNLRARCAEIIAWQKSGVLQGEALRGYASSQWYADEHNALQMAEHDTAREAFTMLAAPAAPVAVGQEPVAWAHKATGILRRASAAKGADFHVDDWRPLYAVPPAAEQPDAVKVDRELLERIAARGVPGDGLNFCPECGSSRKAIEELRAMLAGGDKP